MKAKQWQSSCVSGLSVLGVHLTLTTVGHLWISTSSFSVIMISAAALLLWIVFGRWCRRCLGISASAPTFVILNVLLLWGVYICFIQRVVGLAMAATFNIQCIVLTIGFWRMLFSDPGYVRYESISVETDHMHTEGNLPASGIDIQINHEQVLFVRAKYCTKCRAYIDRFDHHCPAFGNCVVSVSSGFAFLRICKNIWSKIIGRRNHRLFIFLLITFISVEMTYALCLISCFPNFKNLRERKLEASYLDQWMASTRVFAIFQVFWQVPFLFWHLYCISLNVTTDEWVNWKKYPEFQLEMPPEPGNPFPRMKFRNPYDKGIMQNIMEFINSKL